MNHWLIIACLASLGLDWPALPGNARLAELLVVPTGIAVLMRGRRISTINALDVAVLAYLAASLVAVVVSDDRSASLVEFVRHVYLAGLYVLVACAIHSGAIHAVRTGLSLMGIVLAVPAVLLAVAYLVQPVTFPAAGQVMPLPYVGEVLRLRGFTASPTMFASVLTMALPFGVVAASLAEDHRAKRRWVATVAAMLAAMFLSFSHVWAGAALGLTIVAWPYLKPWPFVRRAAIAAVVVSALAFNATLIASVHSSVRDASVPGSDAHPYAVDSGTYHIAGYSLDYAVMSYFRIKQLAWEAFMMHPVTGVGLDRFHVVTRAAFTAGRLPHTYREIDPHSTVLGRLAETGLVGGITLLALWAVVLVTGIRLIRAGDNSRLARAALAGTAGLLLASINVDIMNFRFVWAAFGVMRGLSEGDA